MCATTSSSVAGGTILRYSAMVASSPGAPGIVLAFTFFAAAADFSDRNPQLKLIWITPPFLASAAIISSVMLRGTLQSARQEECEAMIGALLTASASQNVLSAVCEISTIIPSRFISRTTCLPNGVRPLWCSIPALSISPEESAQLLVLVWVRVM